MFNDNDNDNDNDCDNDNDMGNDNDVYNDNSVEGTLRNWHLTINDKSK